DVAKETYQEVIEAFREKGIKVETGEFQAMMEVYLVNDGPVTMLLDSKKLF
ncbi:MAG: D-tyrosyl-tRNA(Tyr) deacylase, partial [Deltaproteobacteria bacterium]